MTDSEANALDVWIAENAMGWTKCTLGHIDCAGRFAVQGGEVLVHERSNYVKRFNPTKHGSDSMAVFQRCAVRLGLDGVTIFAPHKEVLDAWTVRTRDESNSAIVVSASTIHIAICLFAKKLFA